MKRTLIGAVSLSALMAVGLAACGQNDTTYAENENGPYAETADEARTADSQTSNVESGDMADARKAAQDYAADPSAADAGETADYDVAQGEAATDNTDVGAYSGEMTLASLSSVRTRDELEDRAGDVFAEADLNGDGVLDRAEYLTLALADAGVSAPEGEGDISEPMDEIASVGGTPAEGGVSAPTQLAGVDEQQKVEAIFEEVSDDGETMTLEQMREAFLARFDEADENGDRQLDTLERMKFAQLVAGEETLNGAEPDLDQQ